MTTIPVTPGSGANVSLPPYAPLGFQALALSGTAQNLTVPSGAIWAFIIAETATAIPAGQAAARYRDDGTNPTATVGWPIYPGVPVQYQGNLATFAAIQQVSSVTLSILYYN